MNLNEKLTRPLTRKLTTLISIRSRQRILYSFLLLPVDCVFRWGESTGAASVPVREDRSSQFESKIRIDSTLAVPYDEEGAGGDQDDRYTADPGCRN